MAAIVAGGGRADYASAKAGLERLNRAVTKEFAPFGIRCNLVHPSLIETNLLKQRHPCLYMNGDRYGSNLYKRRPG